MQQKTQVPQIALNVSDPWTPGVQPCANAVDCTVRPSQTWTDPDGGDVRRYFSLTATTAARASPQSRLPAVLQSYRDAELTLYRRRYNIPDGNEFMKNANFNLAIHTALQPYSRSGAGRPYTRSDLLGTRWDVRRWNGPEPADVDYGLDQRAASRLPPAREALLYAFVPDPMPIEDGESDGEGEGAGEGEG